jgi:hypothetical protein
VEAVQADRGEDIGNVGSGDVELGEESNFAAAMEASTCNLRVTVTKYSCKIRSETMPCWRGDVRLQAGRRSVALERVALLSEDEDVGVEKATSGHRVSRNESRLD